MSFETVCQGCGAPSGPSVGVCPFCKTLMTHDSGGEPSSIGALADVYRKGNITRALAIGAEMENQKPALRSDLAFVLTYAKILIECEAPTSKIRSLLVEALFIHPDSVDVMDYVEILDAKGLLREGLDDPGEVILRNLIKRSPSNVHAHFMLGTHLFWIENRAMAALPHLEATVRLHPTFLRAWGCLGAIYKKLGHQPLAQMAFQKCADLESDARMRAFFLNEAK